MAHKSTIYTGGKKTPGVRFQGETMKCIMCGKEQASDPKVESGWTYIEVDGQGYYVCPDELPGKRGSHLQFQIAYRKIFKKIAELSRP